MPLTTSRQIVVGTAPLAGLYTSVAAAVAHETLSAAWVHGVRRFDTAPHYGAGRAERRLGDFLATADPGAALISTKVGRTIVRDEAARPGAFRGIGGLRSQFDFSPGAIRRQLRGSLRRLRVDRVDTVFLHDPDEHLPVAVGAIAELQRLREEGLLTRIGVGTNRVDTALALLEHTALDVVMIAGRLTLLDDAAATRLLPECAARGVELWAAGVFNGGILADPREDAYFDYRPASSAVLNRARSMAAACERHGIHLRDAAVNVPLRYPEVGAVVLGLRSPHEVDEALHGLGARISDDLWSELDAIRAEAIDT